MTRAAKAATRVLPASKGRLKLTDSVTILNGVGPARAELLNRLDIKTIGELLAWVPRRYFDCTKPTPIANLQIGGQVAVLATIKSVHSRRSKRGQSIVTALLEDDTGTVEAWWFNQSFITQFLAGKKQAVFIGTVRKDYHQRRPILSAPKIENRLVVLPIYSLTSQLTSKYISGLIAQILPKLELKDELPATARQQLSLVDLATAWRQIHQPKSMFEVAAARRRLVFDQLYQLQLTLAKIRRRRGQFQSRPVKSDVGLLKEFVARLPFKLTDDQRRAIWQMTGELNRPSPPMHRLLNGDVGSGKTVVAAALILLTVKAGWRAVLMAPTEILTYQHHQTLKTLLDPFKVKVGLVTAQSKEWAGEVLVGTHALIKGQDQLKNVALVVIDEQHRFGVEQRTALVKQASNSQVQPHLLTLTATPIPRSLALVLFGDLDISLLKERPAERQAITTRVVQRAAEQTVYQAIAQTVARGEQAYVICPLIEQIVDDTIIEDERKSVTLVYKKLSTAIFPDLKVAVLHGQHKSEQKEKILRRFQAGQIDILVATSVVEVGVDIPGATIMLIEGADRFGVAQLHQLRGRIGRSDKPATCYLMVDQASETAASRLQKVASTNDGFELSRFDLAQRGPGDLVGVTQKGLNHLFLEGLDFELLKAAQDLARKQVGV